MSEQSHIDYSRKWYVMAAVSMGIFLATIDGSIVNVALPTLVRALDTNFATIQWVVLAYLLTITTLLLSMGRLGDIIGKKSLYMVGFTIFTVGSGLCGLAPTVYWLIGFRVVQAIGAAITMALGPAIITEAFPNSERGKALGLAGLVVSVGVGGGPTLGGLILQSLDWGWIFFVNIPVGIVGLVMIYFFVQKTDPKANQTFDYYGAATLFISLVSLSLALTLGQEIGFLQPTILALFVGFVIFLIAFIWVEQRAEQPMVKLDFFEIKTFSVSVVSGFVAFVAIAGMVILLPFYLENVLQYNTLQTGLMLSVIPIALGVTAPLAGSLSDKYGTRIITLIGLMVMGLGFFSASTLSTETSTIGYILRMLPVGIGVGIFMSPNNSAIMGALPKSALGVASGFLALARTLGQTVGVATLGALWAARVLAYAEVDLGASATEAAPAAQVIGLNQTFLVIAALVVLTLVLNIWGMSDEEVRDATPSEADDIPQPVAEAKSPAAK